jgi:cell division protein FtsW
VKVALTYLKGDKVIWIMTFILALLSLVSVYSFTSILAAQNDDVSTEKYLFKHAIMLVSGFVLMYYVHQIKFTAFSKISKLGIWVAVILLLVTLVAGVSTNQAGRWLLIPVINQKFQPSDFARVILIIYVARLLAINQDKIRDFKTGVLPILIPVVLVCGLILPENFSTAALLFGLCLLMMFFGRVPFKYLLAIVGGAVAVFALMVLLASAYPKLLPRLDTWTSRMTGYGSGDPAKEYQQNNAQTAIYDGGILGKGPGNGQQKTILPQAYADFIYAAFIEEFGSIGGLLLLLLYLIFLYRTIRIASRCEKIFGTLMVVGLGLNILFQAYVNMAVSTKLVPVTGQNMPLLSMGGTSTWFTCIAIGIILSVARSTNIDKSGSDPVTLDTNEQNTEEENAVA